MSIINDDNVFSFNVDEDQKNIDIVTKILFNPSSYNSMSNRNKEYNKQFSVEICAERYLKLFSVNIKK